MISLPPFFFLCLIGEPPNFVLLFLCLFLLNEREVRANLQSPTSSGKRMVFLPRPPAFLYLFWALSSSQSPSTSDEPEPPCLTVNTRNGLNFCCFCHGHPEASVASITSSPSFVVKLPLSSLFLLHSDFSEKPKMPTYVSSSFISLSLPPLLKEFAYYLRSRNLFPAFLLSFPSERVPSEKLSVQPFFPPMAFGSLIPMQRIARAVMFLIA